jgi:predicted phosphodiesterase
MKILVFTDVHGVLNSLIALKQTDDFQNADKKIFLGDIMFGGSRPNECLKFLKDNNIECVLGNNDSYVSDHVPDCDLEQFNDEKGGQLKWMQQHITPENKSYINS